MKIKYIVRVTTTTIDGTHTTRWINCGTDLDAARRVEARERGRKLRICDSSREVRRLTVAA